MPTKQNASPIEGHVVGQFFTLYEGVPKEQYEKIVAAAPFDKCNLLILAFVRTFAFVRGEEDGGTIWVAQFANGRVDGNQKPYPLDPNDTDGDRVKLIVETARKKNPSINVIISLGWGANDVGNAASSPVAFADSVRALVQAYDLNGFDIDFEPPIDVEPTAMLTLAKAIRRSLDKIASNRPMIMTITPAQEDGLDRHVLEAFTYVLPQTYAHGGMETAADWFANQLGSDYSRIVFGLNSESDPTDPNSLPDDPKEFAKQVTSNNAAGMFAWRLNGDSPDRNGLPTFADATEMWELMRRPFGENKEIAGLVIGRPSQALDYQ